MSAVTLVAFYAIEVDGDCLQVEGWGDVVSNNAAKFFEGVERVEC